MSEKKVIILENSDIKINKAKNTLEKCEEIFLNKIAINLKIN